jgi:O-antigen/teichoic acid export membrane protein
MFIPSVKKSWFEFKHRWAFIKWLVASNFLWTVAHGVYPWFIAAFCGVEANGIWAVSVSVATLGMPVRVGLQNLMGPRIMQVFTNSGALEMRTVVFKSALLLAFSILIFCIPLLVFGNEVVILLYGEKYSGNGLIVSLMALNLVVSSLIFPFSRGLFAMERADVEFKINIVLMVMFALSGFLVRSFGLPGAAFGLVASNSLSVLLRGIAFNRIARSRLADMAELVNSR